MQGPNRGYRKFIVLAHQRSGSSMIIGSLRRHPQVVGFGELFGRLRIGFNVEGYEEQKHSEAMLNARNAFPIEFLDNYIFSSYPEDKRAVGFKLFPDQLAGPHLRCVWEWIGGQRDLAVIFLTRRNLLATYVLLLVAKETGAYGIRQAAERPSITVSVDLDECLASFREREEYNALARERIAGHQVLELAYEELAADPAAHLVRIQEFLGLDVRPPEITAVRKETRPLSQVIANYEEVRKRLAGTKWAGFLEER